MVSSEDEGWHVRGSLQVSKAEVGATAISGMEDLYPVSKKPTPSIFCLWLKMWR